jgi:hypothetical protein
MASSRNPRHGFTIQFATEEPELDAGDEGVESLLSVILGKLKDGDEATAHAVLGLAQCLQHMASAALDDDRKRLAKWADHAHELVEEIESKGDDDGE